MSEMGSANALLEVRDLYVEFSTASGIVRAVNGASFSVNRGETLAVLGESGCGKSVTAATIMGLLESPPGRVCGGQILFAGNDLLTMSNRERRALSGNRLGMVFQDALTALNPVYSVGWQIAEGLRKNNGLSAKDAQRESVRLLDRVGIPSAATRATSYPHELSGGQRQRVLIAMALSGNPDILIADEPTTALDVTVQAQIMDLLAELRADTGMGLVLITHDLGLVAEAADRVAVMYAGRVVESAHVDALFGATAHPYTLGLMRSVPRAGSSGLLEPIRGLPPDLRTPIKGCAFYPRCDFAESICDEQIPVFETSSDGCGCACHRREHVRQP